jgi:hypothetical protein
LGDPIKVDEMCRASGMYMEKRNVYRVLVGKSRRKGQFGGPRHGCEDDNVMDAREVVWDKW